MFAKAIIRCRCGRWVSVKNVRIGDRVECRCGKRFKIGGVAPVERVRRAYRAQSMN